jgi:8-oxo-dGTP pyrophosphatase MutT (NUDIX family)
MGRLAGAVLMPAPAVPAASVVVLRGEPFEVLMLRRPATSSFVPNAWVFPGGAVEDADRTSAGELTAARAAAVRETLEETGLQLEAGSLVLTSRWITPEALPKRFDTWFFVAEAPAGATVTPQQEEVTEVLWIEPREALRRNAEGAMQMVFPTLRNLEAIADFPSIAALLDARRNAHVEPVMPVIVNGKPALR